VARGKSGRVVVDVDPALKARMYVALAQHDLTMRDWFMQRAQELVGTRKKSASPRGRGPGANDGGST